MLRFFRLGWWRVRWAGWYLGWRISLAMAPGRMIQGVRVKLGPLLDNAVGAHVLELVELALNLIAQYDPRRMRRIARDIRCIWIHQAAYADAFFIEDLRLCVLNRGYVTARDTAPDMIAATIVHEAVHARLQSRNIQYVEPLRARVERLCDAETLAFARRLPGGESLAHRIIESRPTDEATWSDESLHRRLADGKRIDLAATGKEIDDSNLPACLKRFLHRLVRWRAA
jgi:hypothetical protein